MVIKEEVFKIFITSVFSFNKLSSSQYFNKKFNFILSFLICSIISVVTISLQEEMLLIFNPSEPPKILILILLAKIKEDNILLFKKSSYSF